jgi:hypothetical protein
MSKKECQMIQICAFKKKKKEGGKTPTWRPVEGSNAWWPLEGSKLGGLWKEKEKHLFHLFSFSPLINT